MSRSAAPGNQVTLRRGTAAAPTGGALNVTLTTAVVGGHTVLTVNPNATLLANTQYTLRLSNNLGIRDLSGKPPPGDNEVVHDGQRQLGGSISPDGPPGILGRGGRSASSGGPGRSLLLFLKLTLRREPCSTTPATDGEHAGAVWPGRWSGPWSPGAVLTDKRQTVTERFRMQGSRTCRFWWTRSIAARHLALAPRAGQVERLRHTANRPDVEEVRRHAPGLHSKQPTGRVEAPTLPVPLEAARPESRKSRRSPRQAGCRRRRAGPSSC